MLPFPSFKLERPDKLTDLIALAAIPDARLVAGGTDLLPNLKHRIEKPPIVVAMTRVDGLHGITQTDDELVIGATTTLSEVAAHPSVVRHYPALADACRTVATSTIQEMGTLGGNVMLDTRCRYLNQPDGWRNAIGGCLKCDGNVCHVAPSGSGCYAAHSADTVPVLWVMGAQLTLISENGERKIAISDLYQEDGIHRTSLQRGEILTAIHLPTPRGFVAHRKLRLRGSIDYPLLLCAVRREGSGATAVLSAIGPQPIVIQVDRASELVEAAWAATKPLNTHMASTSWRRHMVRVEVKRALEATTR
jgi:4-hydroxybenzoyl-CoA reductase subunit beta